MKAKAKVKLLHGGNVVEAGETFTVKHPDCFDSAVMEALSEPAKAPQKRKRRNEPASESKAAETKAAEPEGDTEAAEEEGAEEASTAEADAQEAEADEDEAKPRRRRRRAT